MADTEESPAQRQARIRREKREAKIKNSGQDRLDKITKLSGRTPESVRNETSVSTTPQPISRSVSPALPPTPTPGPMSDADQKQMQEEFVRAMLRNPNAAAGASPQPPQPGGTAESEDPMMQMLQSMLSGANGDPNGQGMPSLNINDIAKTMGVPSFITNLVTGKQDAPETPAQQQEARTWTVLHILFALLAGLYMLFTLDRLTTSFGESPPAPATFQSPFPMFVLGEGLLYGSRTLLSSAPRKTGIKFWIQTVKDLIRDALVMVFLLGVYLWWHKIS